MPKIVTFKYSLQVHIQVPASDGDNQKYFLSTNGSGKAAAATKILAIKN